MLQAGGAASGGRHAPQRSLARPDACGGGKGGKPSTAGADRGSAVSCRQAPIDKFKNPPETGRKIAHGLVAVGVNVHDPRLADPLATVAESP